MEHYIYANWNTAFSIWHANQNIVFRLGCILIWHCIQHMTHANLNTAFSIWHMPIGTLHSAYDTCQLEHCIHHMTHANQDSLFSIWHMQIWTLFSTWHIQLYHWVKLRCIKETYYFSLNNQSIYVIGVNLDYNYFV